MSKTRLNVEFVGKRNLSRKQVEKIADYLEEQFGWVITEYDRKLFCPECNKHFSRGNGYEYCPYDNTPLVLKDISGINELHEAINSVIRDK